MPTTTAGGLNAALAGMQAAVIAAINGAGILEPGQVGIGSPFGVVLASLLTQMTNPPQGDGGNWQATVYPYGKARDATRYRPVWVPSGPLPTPTFTATVDGADVTFAGVPISGANVTVFYRALGAFYTEPAIYQTTSADTLETIAAGCAAAINAFASPGVTGSATGDVLSVTGISGLEVAVGVSGTAGIEVGRQAQDLMVSVWAPNPYTRAEIVSAIQSNVGTAITRFITLADGTQMEVVAANLWLDEKSQSSYSLYEAHFVFACEYPIVLTMPGVEIEAPAVTTTQDGVTSPPLYGDGR